MLYRSFEISTANSKDIIIKRISKIGENKFKFFPVKLLTGSIDNDYTLNAIINLPFPLSDPFKNRVTAYIIEGKDRNILKGKVNFGLLNSILCFLFYIPYLFNVGEGFDLKGLGMLTLMNLIIIFLLYLKLNWDSKRLKRKLNEIL